MKRNEDGSNILDGSATHKDKLTHFDEYDQAVRASAPPPPEPVVTTEAEGEDK